MEREVDARLRVEERLRDSEERFRQLFEQSADGLYVHDETGRILDCNYEACRSLGYSREEMLTLSVRDFATELISDEERAAKKGGTLWQLAMTGEPGKTVGIHVGEFWRKDGTSFPVEVTVGSISYGGRRRILGSAHDITGRKAVEERLMHQAFHDSLTGLPNRALFLDRLERALARADRERRSVTVFFMDLDDFKLVNDSLGHAAGDELLIAVAGRLQNRLRSEDTVARLGGDEFTILLQNVRGPDEATYVASRILKDFREPFGVGGCKLSVTTSIGIATSTPSGGEDPNDLLRYADEALYKAKQRGKAQYEVSDEHGPTGDN
ncbi:MAG: diguanylate cyclase/phosphodiesterase (GGDEF & EAL domains) with PAS/PAC sensor(s) [uncultured Rubrobacteraceae bacterium]|uniref:Diguanylate cyclase/phosphodiesterase (GGDEF & EAL domains) with PAS/PAC sensor(S) n=1 Tax=uncultured Rubrobacteraceae bacterium TaxID=349277 RepID=A0A6J4R214_9ACTN|nr:MAG: diguanylate cyclase/phosphodiesterase (GGDEF & EAL domains) with PAS/PAC sensor(s) [uncultured Rubrobacteraceae bacterium]